ncbi:unnamed protein product, partial [Polarella glacialis]
MAACIAGGRWEASLAACLDFGAHGVASSTASVLAALESWSAGGCWEMAVRQLRPTVHFGLDRALANAAAGACLRQGQWRGSLQVLHMARAQGVEPDELTLRVAVAAGSMRPLSRWRGAIQALSWGRGSCFLRPGVLAFNTAMASCRDDLQPEK